MKLSRLILSVGFGTLLSRVFGFARDVLVAARLGASPINDMFLTAFRLANMLRSIFAEGALGIVFVPELSKTIEKHGKKKAFIFASQLHLLLLICLGSIVIVGTIIMPQIMWYTVPGFRGNLYVAQTTVLFARITFPYLLCISLASFYGGILNSFNRFLPFALAPTILNVTVVLALLFCDFLPTTGHTLAVFTTVGGILELFWMLFFLLRLKYKLSMCKIKLTKQIKNVFKKMLPIVFSSCVAHLNTWVSMMMLSFFSGGISYIYYAERVVQLPIALIGTSIGTVLLPALAKVFVQNNNANAILVQNKAIETALLLTIPAAVGLFALAHDIIFLLFERGNFSAHNTQMTSQVLRILSAGLPAFIMVKLFQIKFYAKLDTKTPVVISVICLCVNIAICLITTRSFQHRGVALANSLSGWLNILLLLVFARNKFGFHFNNNTLTKIIVYCLCSGGMLSAMEITKRVMHLQHLKMTIIIKILLGSVVYFVSYFSLKTVLDKSKVDVL